MSSLICPLKIGLTTTYGFTFYKTLRPGVLTTKIYYRCIKDTDGGECPLVVDHQPSCGDSRFGCWVCTLVKQDKSMSAMVQNDLEKSWMEPLLQLRNDLTEKDHSKRDFRRLKGFVKLMVLRVMKIQYPVLIQKQVEKNG